MKKTYLLTALLVAFIHSVGQSPDFKKQEIHRYLTEQVTPPLLPSDLRDLQITDDYKSHDAPTNYVYVRQGIGPRPVFNATATLALLDGKVVYGKSALIYGLHKRSIPSVNTLNAKAAFDILVSKSFTNVEVSTLKFPDSELFSLEQTDISEEPIKFQLGYYFLDNQMRMVWKINWLIPGAAHWYDALVDAQSGELIARNDLVQYCDFGCNDVHGSHSNDATTTSQPKIHQSQELQATLATNSYEVFPRPIESPNHGIRSVVVDPADATASPFGWHDINGIAGEDFTTTRGNNVLARDDIDGNNSGGKQFDGGSQFEFKAPFDINQSAELFLDASIINLFYWNNIMHDVWYHYGFDEPAGNFQENNYGKGGAASDFVNADAQDGSGTNNANFATPNDGQNPRMQMFIWRSAAGSGDYLQVNTPGALARKYSSVRASFPPFLTPTPVKADLVLVNDGSANPAWGCDPLQNASEVNGKIALIERNSCTFVSKILNAQNAGAIGVVMINNVGTAPIPPMGGTPVGISIPSVMISQADGTVLRNALASGAKINVSLYDSSGAGTLVLDSDFDNGVIVHEYTHGISTRLTGGPNSSCLSGNEQMGEGWSDFLALVMTHVPGAKGSDKRGIGTYVSAEPTDGGGIRPYPYSTSMTINPVTYDDIKLGQFTAPHGVGSVWCSMLWDMYWALIDQYGFDNDIYQGTGGNNMAMHLVMDGLKLQGCSPGFIDGRDAILAADKLRYGGANAQLIWQVFANRGLGYSANQGSSQSKTDGTEAFDMPPSLAGYQLEKRGPSEAKSGDTITFTLVLRNVSDVMLNSIGLKDTISTEGIYLDHDGNCNLTANGQRLNIIMNNIAAGDSVLCTYRVVIKKGLGAVVLIEDDMESGDGNWTSVVTNGSGDWQRVSTKANSGSMSWFVNDPASESDRHLETEVDLRAIGKATLSFDHLFNTEDGWDGAVVEISNGNNWTDLGSKMISNGYNGNIAVNPASAISGRPAFTGKNPGYPSSTFMNTTINLNDYVGSTRKIRFRFVSDGLQGGEGWYIDDVKLWSSFDQLRNGVSAEGDGLKAVNDQTFTTILVGEIDTTIDPTDTTVIVVIDSSNMLLFYPNPVTTGDLQVFFRSSNLPRLTLYMYNMLGQEVWNGEIKPEGKQVVPMRDLPSGSYIIRINRGATDQIERIIKIE